MSAAKYYIGTGELNCFYTLRYTFDETHKSRGESGELYTVTRDYHIRNLSTDREQAIAKAHEITGLPLSANFEVGTITRREDIDWSVLQAGKNAGKSIHELRETEEGKSYLLWLAENCKGSRNYAKTVELLEALLASELGERKQERDDKATQEAQERAATAERCKDIISVLKDAGGNFCESVASDLSNGNIPSGRGWSITVDIFAKAHGRRGSKAYDAAYELAAETLGEPK